MQFLLTLDKDFKRRFFDRAAVMRALSKKEQAFLAKGGAKAMYSARGRIRRSLKRRAIDSRGMSRSQFAAAQIAEQKRRASSPGESPRGTRFRKTIFFNYDPPRGVVVGPIGFSNSNVPSLLEFGGLVSFEIYQRRGQFHRGTAKMEPRPYMGPTLRDIAPKLPQLYAQMR